MSSLTNRLDRLEDVTNPERLIVVWQNHGETENAAIARRTAEHPGEATPCNVRWENPQ